MGIRTGIKTGITAGISAGISPALVPTDGPDSVFVPSTTDHFSSLSIPPPTDLYVCDESSGDLASATGTAALVASGTGHLYGQSVTGWDASFVGFADGDTAAWGKPVSLSAGESCFILGYAALDIGGSARNVMLVDGAGDRIVMAAPTGQLGSWHGGSDVDGSVDYRDLSTVNAIMWSRNATDNASGTFTDSEKITVTHDETATAGDISIGGGTACYQRIARFYVWRGSEADALISAGLANEELLKLLKWSIPY